MRPRADRQYLFRETVRKDYAGATVAFKAVTRLAPDDATAWYRLAALEVRQVMSYGDDSSFGFRGRAISLVYDVRRQLDSSRSTSRFSHPILIRHRPLMSDRV
jgi:hypothetical protein